MIIEFTHYLHDDLNSRELKEEIEVSSGYPIDDELMEKIGRPFYEVRLSCSLDTETGKIVVFQASWDAASDRLSLHAGDVEHEEESGGVTVYFSCSGCGHGYERWLRAGNAVNSYIASACVRCGSSEIFSWS